MAAYELDRSGKKETLQYGKSEIDKIIEEREKARASLNAMEDVTSRRDPFDKDQELAVDRATAQAAAYQSTIADADKQISELVKKAKAMEEMARRPGAKKTTSSGAVSESALVGGSTQQSVLTSVL